MKFMGHEMNWSICKNGFAGDQGSLLIEINQVIAKVLREGFPGARGVITDSKLIIIIKQEKLEKAFFHDVHKY